MPTVQNNIEVVAFGMFRRYTRIWLECRKLLSSNFATNTGVFVASMSTGTVVSPSQTHLYLQL